MQDLSGVVKTSKTCFGDLKGPRLVKKQYNMGPLTAGLHIHPMDFIDP